MALKIFSSARSLRTHPQYLVLAAAVIWAAVAGAVPTVAAAGDLAPAGAPDVQKLSAIELASHIDASLASAWAGENRRQAPPADDAEFLRRLQLDMIGKIPSVAEARAFLDSDNPDKRRNKVEELLKRGAFAAHFARVWRDLLLAGANNNNGALQFSSSLETWLRLRFATNIPYDQMVRELLTDRQAQLVVTSRRAAAPSVVAFYQANESKPEMLAASTSRLFLGVQVQCAQCHDHPFAHWKRKEFWSFAAFFAGRDGDNGPNPQASLTGVSRLLPNSIRIPETDITVQAAFLGGGQPDWNRGESKEVVLARWMTANDNPLFARAAVNRVWEHFFGRGFVFPVDNLDRTDPPLYPQVFADISRQFVLHGYDLHYLIRALASTRAYQATSAITDKVNDDDRHFARMPVRRMSGDQLFDSIVQATGFREAGAGPRQQVFDPFGGGGVRGAFLAKFADQSVPKTEAETSILQALSLMNGKLVTDATGLDTSETLVAVNEAPFLDTYGRIETLFLATLSRKPDGDELQQFAAYVAPGGSSAGESAALGDVFWALLNSSEFLLNH